MGGQRQFKSGKVLRLGPFMVLTIIFAVFTLMPNPAYANLGNLGNLGNAANAALGNLGNAMNAALGNIAALFGFGNAGQTNCATAGNTMGGILCNISASVQVVPGLFSAFAYIFGLVLGLTGIQKLYEHVQAPHQTPPMEFVKRFIAGGAFFALPMVLEVVKNTITGGMNIMHNITGTPDKASAGGLDAMMVNFVKDIVHPMWGVISGFTYLAGIVLVIIGISRLLKSAQEGPRGPGGIGTIMTFLTAGMLLSLDTMLNNFSLSLFDPAGTQATVTTRPMLAYTAGMTATEVDHVRTVIGSAIIFMMILGWISFVRGIFIIRDVAEGNQQASMMSGITHLLGGALALNLGSVINAVQNTLGLTGFGVDFI